MKKGLIILLVVGLLCCIATLVGGFVVYNNYILPNSDSDSTTTINGQSVTQMRRTPTTFNNMIIEPQIDFIKKINDLGKMINDSSTKLEAIQQQVADINSAIDKNVQALDSYQATLVQYNDYKAFIDATKSYYSQYKAAINTAYSESNLQKIFAAEISQADYDRILAEMDALNQTSKRLDEEFGKAQEAFSAKYNVKLEAK